jgi:hypothetical protein
MIFKFSERLFGDLKGSLSKLRPEKDVVKNLEAAVLICIQSMARLRKFFKENKPVAQPDKIRFFKETKPLFKAQLIFYQFILEAEKNKPGGAGVEELTDYYLGLRTPLLHFFESNKDFYRYMRAQETYLDEWCFLPGVYNVHLSPDDSIVDGDEEFTTSHDSKAARVLAHKLIGNWLEATILKLNNKEDLDLDSFIAQEMMVWTQTDIALVENIYGWKETNAINHGKTSVAAISRYMQKVFHVDLGNVSDSWNTICERANPVIYMDAMSDGVKDRKQKKLNKR